MAVGAVDMELETIFGSSGKHVLQRECEERYGVSLIDAVERPEIFKSALYYLLGDLGSSLVMGRIASRVRSRAPAAAIPMAASRKQ
jgi:hypothetical protein